LGRKEWDLRHPSGELQGVAQMQLLAQLVMQLAAATARLLGTQETAA